MRKILVVVLTAALFLLPGVLGAIVTAAPPEVGQGVRPVPGTVITLTEDGWSDHRVGSWDPRKRIAIITGTPTLPIQILLNNFTLDGGANLITGSGSGYGLWMQGLKNVKVKNLALRGFDIGVYVERCTNPNLDKITAKNNRHGIYTYMSRTVAVSRADCRENTKHGIVIDSCTVLADTWSLDQGNNASYNGGHGIYVKGSAHGKLLNNTATNNGGHGILVESSSNWIESGNIEADNGLTASASDESRYAASTDGSLTAWLGRVADTALSWVRPARPPLPL